MARRVRSEYSLDAVDRPIGFREARYGPVDRAEHYGDAHPVSPPAIQKRLAHRRPFVAWDGEGYSDSAGQHHYMLFGSSLGGYVTGSSLGTAECLDLLLDTEYKNPDTIHVIFAGNYDVNMILRDVPIPVLQRLKLGLTARWGPYRMQYIKGKWFRVSRDKVTVTLYDVFTFFMKSFVRSLREWVGTNSEIESIDAGKARRSAFTYSDLDYVKGYWTLELRYLVQLCDALRDNLTAAGIRISRWHGPGAVASAVLSSRKFRRVEFADTVHLAAQYAYFGGRFEPFKIGRYDGPVLQYDVRSAYPAAIATLPDLRNVRWRSASFDEHAIQPFGLYRISIEGGLPDSYTGPGPFPWRNSRGAVYYPTRRHGGTWVWGTELSAVRNSAWANLVGVVDVLLPDIGIERPFAWIADMYEQRAEWKTAGIPAQLALKLAMNSIYGKMAQQVGAKYKDGKWSIPTFHQLEYAGYITAYTRALIWTALGLAGSSAIAVETDAIFTTSPLTTLPLADTLGSWDQTQYSGICYIQSGLYLVRGDSGDWAVKSRGFTRGNVDPIPLLDWVDHTTGYQSHQQPYIITETRFRTIGTHLGKPGWRTWQSEPRKIHMGLPGGKREHHPFYCALCSNARGNDSVSYGAGLHDTVPALQSEGDGDTGPDYSVGSHRYPLVWRGEGKQYSNDAGEDVYWEDE